MSKTFLMFLTSTSTYDNSLSVVISAMWILLELEFLYYKVHFFLEDGWTKQSFIF